MAESFLYAGDFDRALAMSKETLVRANATEGAASVVPMLMRIRACALVLQQNYGEAAEALSEALELARSLMANLEVAFMLEATAEMRRRSGEEADSPYAERSAILADLDVVRTPAVFPQRELVH